MRKPSEVWKVLFDEEPLNLEPPKPRKRRMRRLTDDEYDEVLTNYWYRRPETAHDRNLFVAAAQDWIVYAFLFENADHGKGRNHEITAPSDTQSLMTLLDGSCLHMQRDITCRVEMRSVCWWDVQEHYHNLRRRDINTLAEDLMEPLIHDAINLMRRSGFIRWHSGVWTLSPSMSREHILRLKRQGRIFLAPEPSKLSGDYAA